jgi:two-component system, OmpR family, KDP operon response regulator KdpE
VREIRTVLLVEDDSAWARLTNEAFVDGAPHVVVEWCSTGAAAVARFERRPWPDAVLLDLNLPDLSGLEVIQALRRLRDLPRPVIVVLSASRAASDRAAVALHGALEHRQKPTSYTELRDLARGIAAGTVGSVLGADPSAEGIGLEGPFGGSQQP